MIDSKETLCEYLRKDKYALGMNRRRPKFFGDEIWKYEIALRKDEYYTNCGGFFALDFFGKFVIDN